MVVAIIYAKTDTIHLTPPPSQLGYIVALFNNHELGIHHVEFVIQSTAHPASTLCTRVEKFVQDLCGELLPPRAGLPTASELKKAGGAAAEVRFLNGSNAEDSQVFQGHELPFILV